MNLASEFATLAVVTTKGSEFSKALLAHLGVLPFFKAIVGKDEVSEPKPSSEPILRALSLLGRGKENAFMVGDTHLDIKAAQNAGISCVAVSCGYESAENLAKHGVPVLSNAYEAVKFISLNRHLHLFYIISQKFRVGAEKNSRKVCVDLQPKALKSGKISENKTQKSSQNEPKSKNSFHRQRRHADK